jgi:hypothetical protein
MSFVWLVSVTGLGSASMLWWLAAAAIPIVLHFLYRRRQRSIPWAAMQLLHQVLEKESKRIRIEQLLLLALRILLLCLLAFALARPFISDPDVQAGETVRRPPKLWVIAIDASYPMGYREQDGTWFQQAQRRAEEVINSAQRGDAFLLVTLKDPPRAVISFPTFDPANVLAELQSMTVSGTGSDAAGSLSLIRDLSTDALEDDRVPRDRQLVIFSHLGRAGWESMIEGEASQTLIELQSEMRVDIERIGEPGGVNAAIDSVRPATSRVIAGSRLQVDVEVSGYGAPVTDLPVQLTLDGRTIGSETIDLESGETRSVRFESVLESTGWSVLTASIPEDNLSVDDRRQHVLEVRDAYRLLLVEAQPGDSRFFRLALKPDASPRVESRSRDFGTISAVELPAVDLDGWDCVVLNDVSQISERGYTKLLRFVEEGGSLICNFGPRTRSENWNRWQTDHRSLLGFQFDDPSEVADWLIDPLEYRSPVVVPFYGYPNAGLLTTPIFRFWNIDMDESVPPLIDLAATAGQPLIVRQRVGDGWVASVLSAPSSGESSRAATGSVSQSNGLDPTPWNSWTTWPSFLPLVQQLVQVVVNTDEEQFNLEAGEPLQGTLSRPGGRGEVVVEHPNGETRRIDTEDPIGSGTRSWFFTDTERCGVYRVELPDGQRRIFAVNVDTDESSLDALDPEAVPQTAVPADQQAAQALVQHQAEKTDWLARLLLAALIGLLIAESSLACWMGRRLA